MKRISFLICVLFYSFSCFAKHDLESTLINISNDIIFPLEKGSIICVLNFDSPSSEMSAYIQDELTSLVASSGRLKIKLDEIDPITSAYNLEVSSCGLERHLREPKHFKWAISKNIMVKLYKI